MRAPGWQLRWQWVQGFRVYGGSRRGTTWRRIWAAWTRLARISPRLAAERQWRGSAASLMRGCAMSEGAAGLCGIGEGAIRSPRSSNGTPVSLEGRRPHI